MGLLQRAIEIRRAEPPVRVEVFGEDELLESLERGHRHFSHCISIGDPAGWQARWLGLGVPPAIRESFHALLRLEFVDDEREAEMGATRRARVVRRSDVRRAIRFFRRTEREATGYTLHCWQGVSRSPAFGLGLLYLLTGSEAKAGRLLYRIRPDALPHPGIVRYFDLELGCNLSAVNREIRRKRIREMKKDFALPSLERDAVSV